MIARRLTLAIARSRRLLTVVLPDSRALKWSCPARRARNFTFLLMVKRFLVALCVFIFGMESQTHNSSKTVSLNAYRLFDVGLFSELLDKVLKNSASAIPVLVFATAKDDFHLHFVAFLQKLCGPITAHIRVVLPDGQRQSDAFHINLLLLCLALSSLTFQLIEEPAEIEDAADRWLGNGRYLHKVKSEFSRGPECLIQRDNTDLFVLLVDEADLRGANLEVDAKFLANGRRGYR